VVTASVMRVPFVDLQTGRRTISGEAGRRSNYPIPDAQP
jgi:hypothetical protein